MRREGVRHGRGGGVGLERHQERNEHAVGSMTGTVEAE